MSESQSSAQSGQVIEELKNAMYRVQLESGGQVKAHLSTHLKKVIVRLLPGDRVSVEISAFDTSRAKITAKLKPLPTGQR
ncbi:MAG: translation initiation factor IF-1 [Myxococcota bacterium]|nr:translation initiation factor IF-1 [Myxococcota bacterium]